MEEKIKAENKRMGGRKHSVVLISIYIHKTTHFLIVKSRWSTVLCELLPDSPRHAWHKDFGPTKILMLPASQIKSTFIPRIRGDILLTLDFNLKKRNTNCATGKICFHHSQRSAFLL